MAAVAEAGAADTAVAEAGAADTAADAAGVAVVEFGADAAGADAAGADAAGVDAAGVAGGMAAVTPALGLIPTPIATNIQSNLIVRGGRLAALSFQCL